MLNYKDIEDSINFIFKKHEIKTPQYKPKKTYTFLINGAAESGKDSFISCCSKFTQINNISTVDLIKDMAKIVDLHESRHFLCNLKKLVYKHTNFIDMDIETRLKENHLNFVHVREESFFNKIPYNNMYKLLIERPGMNENRFTFNYDKYDHIILNTTLEMLPYKAYDFVKMYCDVV